MKCCLCVVLSLEQGLTILLRSYTFDLGHTVLFLVITFRYNSRIHLQVRNERKHRTRLAFKHFDKLQLWSPWSQISISVSHAAVCTAAGNVM